MNRKSVDLMVGLFVLIGIASLAFLAFRAASGTRVTPKNNYELHAYFDNIGGLQVRAPVRSAGVVVGRVASIDLDTKRYQAEVTIDMDARYHFPKDSSLKILTAGLLGEQFLGIEAGADEAELKDGDQVSMTQSAVLLENLISQFLYNKAADAGDKGDSGAAAAPPAPPARPAPSGAQPATPAPGAAKAPATTR